MSSKSKNKGNSWEREVAAHLSQVYGASFIRVPHSGAYIGGKNSSRKEFLHEGQIRAMKGDIIPPSEWQYFNCECKNYGDFPFHQLTSGSVLQIEKWLEQLLDVADPYDANFLFFKITRKGKYAAAPASLPWDRSNPHCYYKSPKYGDWLIFDYNGFVDANRELILNACTKSTQEFVG